jgi:hypothetical protein
MHGYFFTSFVTSLVSTSGTSTSSVLSLLFEIPNPMSGGESSPLSCPPSFEASSPRRALDGGLRRPDVLLLVLTSAQREIVVSNNSLVKLFSTTLSPHPVSELPESLESSTQGGVAAAGLEEAPQPL